MKYAISCRECQQIKFVEASEDGVKKWQQGELIQRALPELTAEEREMLISRICPECWNKMFKEDEE